MNGIEAEVLQAEATVDRFNELRESMPVGGSIPFDLLSACRLDALAACNRVRATIPSQ